MSVEHVAKHFPDHVVASIDNFVEAVARTVEPLKFKKDNTVPAISACPDELNRDLDTAVNNHFGSHFNLGGLAGYPFTGPMGFAAFSHHLPNNCTAERMIVFSTSHVGVSLDGKTVGKVERPSMHNATSSCGSAVHAYLEKHPEASTETHRDIVKDIPEDLPVDTQQEYIKNFVSKNDDRIHVEGDRNQSMVNAATVLAEHFHSATEALIVHDSSHGEKECIHVNGIIVNTAPGFTQAFVLLAATYHREDGTKEDIFNAIQANL